MVSLFTTLFPLKHITSQTLSVQHMNTLFISFYWCWFLAGMGKICSNWMSPEPRRYYVIYLETISHIVQFNPNTRPVQRICLFPIFKGSLFWILNSICLVNAYAVSPGNKDAYLKIYLLSVTVLCCWWVCENGPYHYFITTETTPILKISYFKK